MDNRNTVGFGVIQPNAEPRKLPNDDFFSPQLNIKELCGAKMWKLKIYYKAQIWQL